MFDQFTINSIEIPLLPNNQVRLDPMANVLEQELRKELGLEVSPVTSSQLLESNLPPW